MSFDADALIETWLSAYGAPDACVAELLCDRHPPEAVALTVIEADLTSRDWTYAELRAGSERAAAALARRGIGPGDRVATLLAKGPTLVVALLGLWRLGAVHVPLFTAFAPPAIAVRLVDSGTRLVIADLDQRAKLDPGPGLEVIDADTFWELVDAEAPGRPAVAAGGDAPLIQIYTSGTTGQPKGVVVPVRALASFEAYLTFAVDLRADDVYWDAADPGWAYGLYYAITTPLLMGRRTLLLRSGFSAALTWSVLDRFGVTNFAAAPTIYRALRAADVPVPDGLALRRCSSAGEPLGPEVIAWADTALGGPIRDHYGQTELGMVANNHHHPALARPLRPGSMGHPMPGWSLAVLADDRDEPVPPGTLGRIAVDVAGSRLFWFDGYHQDQERTAERFTADRRWYLTGDAGIVDADGYLTFSARDDDVIIMAGYRIGPFEVESTLARHPAVAESAVVGVPDALRGEVIEAWVVLRPGVPPGPDLERELQEHVKREYAAHAYPRRVHLVPELPRTPSGKIQRFLLRASAAAASSSAASAAPAASPPAPAASAAASPPAPAASAAASPPAPAASAAASPPAP